jgi:formylglycine-generating enzyme required for sulfatase activity
MNSVGWFRANSEGKTHEVGGKLANELEIYDMSGNVWEWCFDLNETSNRRFRGGSWRHIGADAAVASRGGYENPAARHDSFGFRLARSSGN